MTGCKSNYSGNKENYVTQFKFPDSKERQEVWLRKIPRKNWTPGPSARICELHFEPKYVSKYEEIVVESVKKKIVARHRPVLLENAIPTRFPNLPVYLSEASKIERTDPDERRHERVLILNETDGTRSTSDQFTENDAQVNYVSDIITENDVQVNDVSDVITCFDDFVNSSRVVNKHVVWHFEVTDDHFVAYILDLTKPPTIAISMKVDKCLNFTIL